MKITTEQEQILDSLVCERLSRNQKNYGLIRKFENKKGALIVDYLKQYGWGEDIDGDTAFYIVKTKDNQPLMFFSLKCGELFDPLFDEEETMQNYEEYLLIIQALKNADSDKSAIDEAVSRLKVISRTKELPLYQTIKSILVEKKTKEKLLSSLMSDREMEGNSNISRVSKTYPGVELVHFCTNEKARELWQSFNMGRSMGEVIFWRFIVPKFFAVQDIVGCEYAFLFAADLSEDQTLINYYESALKFKLEEEVGTNKPLYDFSCAFMCQRLSDMRINSKSYFDNFNVDTNDILI